MTLPGDWAPITRGISEGIEDSEMIDNNNLSGGSIDLTNFRSSSRNISANLDNLAVPILHSSRESEAAEETDGRRGSRPNSTNNTANEQDERRNPIYNPREMAYRRPLPQPRPFEGRGDRDIKQFFRVYERYASSCWGQEKSDWVAGLETLLQGWALVL